MLKNRSIAFKLVFLILTSCTIIFVVIFGYNYFVSRRILIKKIEENAKNLTQATVNKIETVLLPVEKVPKQLACSLEHHSYDKEVLLRLLQAMVENNPEIYGSTIAFEPYAFSDDTEYFAPYYYRSDGKIKFSNLAAGSYKYIDWNWYTIPKKLDRPVWSEPYYDEGGGNIIMTTYSVPFYKNVDGQRKLAGVVTADISLSWLQELIASLKIGKSGYGFLISRKGAIVTHPEKDFIMDETIFSLAESQKNDLLHEVGRDMVDGGSGFLPFKSIITGQKMWLEYMPITPTGWSLAILAPQTELWQPLSSLTAL